MSYILIDKIYKKEVLDKVLGDIKVSPNDQKLMDKVQKELQPFVKLTKNELKELIFFSCMTNSPSDAKFVRQHKNLCGNCGKCCENEGPLVVQPEEVNKIGATNGLVLDSKNNYFLMTKPCLYHKEGKCSIYKTRPLSCKAYPVHMKNGQISVARDVDCKYIFDFLCIKTMGLVLKLEEVEKDGKHKTKTRMGKKKTQ